jgi:hypothetical protein
MFYTEDILLDKQKIKKSVCFRAFFALMTEAVRTSETSVYFNEATRRCIPEGCHHQIHRRENLKSH